MIVNPSVDLTDLTARELCEYLGEQLAHGVRYQLIDRYAYLALNELEKRLDTKEEEAFVLPVAVVDEIKRRLPKAGMRTFQAIEKRCKFAWKVWDGKYGPLTPEQADYAVQLLAYCIRRGAELHAAHGGPAPQPYVYKQFDRILNHENTHEGFQRRAAQTIDITDTLKEVLS